MSVTVKCDCCGDECDGGYQIKYIKPKPSGVTYDVYFIERPDTHDFCSFPCLAEWSVNETRKYRGDAPNEKTGNRLVTTS